MRDLFLARGLPGCGKSTLLNNLLSENARSCIVSTDSIRMLFNSNPLDVNGKYNIDGTEDRKVWKFLNELVENRMKKGQTIIIDATFYNMSSIKSYKDVCDRFGYTLHVIDFSKDLAKDPLKALDKHLELSIERNSDRESYKQVPVEVINRMYESWKGSLNTYPDWVDVLSADDFLDWDDSIDKEAVSKDVQSVVVIGDLHGCYSAFMHYVNENPLVDNKIYVFVGDYLDRGIENLETLTFLLENQDKSNFVFLRGNHEKHLENFAKNKVDQIFSKEFLTYTMPQIESVDKIAIKKFCKKLKPYFYFGYGKHDYFVSHGGISILPCIYTNEPDLVEGTGGYPDSELTEETFYKNYNKTIVQIHGHRNINKSPIQSGPCAYNLEGQVEFGGNLRIVEIFKDGTIKPIEIRNEVFRDPESVEVMLPKLRHNPKLIREKELGDGISSFNFTKDCLFGKAWTNLNIKARGLFIDTVENKIVARGYDKFFNLNENEYTREDKLKEELAYPVYAYKKENGYLGLLSWNSRTNNFFIASKSMNTGPFAENFKRILLEKYHINDNKELIDYLKNHDQTLIFEVIDPVFDPHIIKYNEEKVVLLDIVENNFKNEFMSYDDLKSHSFGFEVKELSATLNNWKEIQDLMDKNKDSQFEGFVFTDQNTFRFKYKLPFYSFWKVLRNSGLNTGKARKEFSEQFSRELDYVDSIKSKVNLSDENTNIIKIYEGFYNGK